MGNFRADFRANEAPHIVAEAGEPAVIVPVGGGPSVSLQVKFDELPATQPAAFEVGVESALPTAEYFTPDYPAPAHGDELTVDGRTFKVVGVDVDQEFTILQLEAIT